VVRNVASVSTTICRPQTSKRVLPQSDKPPQGMHNHRFPPNPIGPGSDSRLSGTQKLSLAATWMNSWLFVEVIRVRTSLTEFRQVPDSRELKGGTYYYSEINLCFLMPSCLIFVSSVDRGIPSFAAAPSGPATFPLHSARAISIIFLS